MQETIELSVKKFIDEYARFVAVIPDTVKEEMKMRYEEILELDRLALESQSPPVPESRRKWELHGKAMTYVIKFDELAKFFSPKARPKPRPPYKPPAKPIRAKYDAIGKPKPKPKKP